MGFKGTKGSWMLDEESRNYDIGVVSGSKVICEISTRRELTDEEINANAKLISCSLEMLESLKELYDFYEILAMKINCEDFDEKFRSKWNPIMSNAEQIIKKATE